MPNALAYVSLVAALPCFVALFVIMRPPIAALVAFLASAMLLPERVEIDLPFVPAIGKQEVAALAVLAGALLTARGSLRRARPLHGPDVLAIFVFVGDIGTALTNTDVVVRGPVVLPALSLHEGVSMVLGDVLQLYLPFLLGRALFATARDLHALLAGLAVAGALYTPLLFMELMLSPQLHAWVYGFHQHEFVQTLRGGGYRPTVFMAHGLAVALFMAWAVLAAVVLLKARKQALGVQPGFLVAWNGGFLLACKSLGAALFASVAAPVVWLLRPRAVVRVAAVLAMLVVAYPTLRACGAFPTRVCVDAATLVSARAAQSLQFRFDMESLLADHARERPVFGWGRFRRSMVFDETTGREASVSDGHWIVTYGIRGAWGFIALFALIVAPVLRARRLLGRVVDQHQRTLVGGLALIVALSAVDLLLNALHNSLTLLLAGALWGLVNGVAHRGLDTVGAGRALRAPRVRRWTT